MKYIAIDHDAYLEHHGVKGMKWGVRRYQNKDGSLTKAGERRYQKQEARAQKKERRAVTKSILNDERQFEKQFDATPSGAKLKSRFEKYRNLLVAGYDDNNIIDKYNEAQDAYAVARGKHVYDSLTKKYSEESIRWRITNPYFGYSIKINPATSTRDAFVDNYANDHAASAFVGYI